MSALIPLITEQGLQAVFNATGSGLNATISHVALGDRSYSVPVNSHGHASQTALQHECQRVAIADGRRADHQQINVSFVADGPTEYWVRELGFYLDDGTLFAIWSQPAQALAYKSQTVPLIVGLELVLSALPANSVTIASSGAPLQLIMTGEMAAIGAALANVQLEQLHQAEQIKTLTGGFK